MNLSQLTLAAAATALAVAPLAAQAAPVDRATAPATEEMDLGGSDAVRALIIIIIGAIGMAFLLLTDDEPVSPKPRFH